MIKKEKGKRIFNNKEESKILSLIADLVAASTDDKKKIRARLRKECDFFISRFTSSKRGFTIRDFDNLKITGKIIITS